MYRDGWINTTTQLYNICGASPVNNQIIFFDGHNIHFDDRNLPQTQRKNIHLFILKAGDYTNNHTYLNGPNSKLKTLYIISKAKWMLKYSTTRFQPHHINYDLVETW